MRPAATGALVGVLTLGLAAIGVGAVVAAAGGPDRPAPARSTADTAAPGTPEGGDGRLVLVSGRDDHGLLATARVALRQLPGGGAPSAQVKDGALARVVATSGTWLRIRTVDAPSVQGWVDDFYLRGTVHLVGPAPTCRVRLGSEWLAAGEQAEVLDVRGSQARVRVARTGRTGWVARSAVQELAPEHCGRPTSPASADTDAHGHSHHH